MRRNSQKDSFAVGRARGGALIAEVRSFSSFVTFLVKEAVTDPRGLVRKACSKLGLPNAESHFRSTPAELAEYRGDYSHALELAGEARVFFHRFRNALVKKRVSDELWWFAQTVETSPNQAGTDATRVLYVAGNSRPHTNSGYSKRTHSLVKAIQASGVPISVLTRLGYPSVVGVPFSKKVDQIDSVRYERNMGWIFPVTPKKEFELAKQGIVRVAKRENATILHTTTSFKNAVVVSAAAKELQIPWVYEVRGEIEKTWLTTTSSGSVTRSMDSDHFRLSRQKELEAATAASGVVVLSHLSAKDLVEAGVRRQKICVAPNAAEKSLLQGTMSQREARMCTDVNAEFLVGTVTSVVGYEGLETMIRALPLLPDHVSFLVVGDGTDKRRLEAIAAELNLESRVSFVGRKPQDEIVPWYRSLDAFVVPRIDSPVCRAVTPIKPLAAMALGIPVIASDLPALREVTGGCAKYVEPENPTALAEGIRAVTEGKYESTRARAWAEARTWDRVGNVLREFYQEIEKKGTR